MSESIQALQRAVRYALSRSATPTAELGADDTYSDWLNLTSPGMTWDWEFQRHVLEHLQRVTDGESRKLVISLPPQHGKTSLVTTRYPVWRMTQEPGLRVGIGAYNQSYANRLSRLTRRVARDAGVAFGEKNAANEWETDDGSNLVAVGVGSGITGRSLDLLVIDDPVKNREEADSQAHQERVWEWYMDDLTTRLQEGSAVILIMTRWNEGDLAGRILGSEDGSNWSHVRLPAIAEEDDPMGRAVGVPLCPERFTLATLEERRRILGEGFEGLYQQNPVPRGGLFFRREWFGVVDAVPAVEGVKRIRYWDLAAATKNTSAYTAGVLMAKVPGPDRYYVEDVVRGRWPPAERNEVILQTAKADTARTGFDRTWFEEQPGAAGIETSAALIRKLAGLTVRSDRVTGDKQTRAEPFADIARGVGGAGGVVFVVAANWTAAYLTELASFPRGQYMDQVDSTSGAFNKLARGGPAFVVAGR